MVGEGSVGEERKCAIGALFFSYWLSSADVAAGGFGRRHIWWSRCPPSGKLLCPPHARNLPITRNKTTSSRATYSRNKERPSLNNSVQGFAETI